jgi:hypothetical protein
MLLPFFFGATAPGKRSSTRPGLRIGPRVDRLGGDERTCPGKSAESN